MKHHDRSDRSTPTTLGRKVLITDSSDFFDFHIERNLLSKGIIVHSFDVMTDCCDVALNQRRRQMPLQSLGFSVTEGMFEDQALLDVTVERFAPEIIGRLVAHASVRYSLETPRANGDSNVVGTFNVKEAAMRLKVGHLCIASNSSIYAASTEMPFAETENTDSQLIIYAAINEANEAMGHSYAHLWNLPTTILHFFTVYGPWSGPDTALFKFVDAILDGRAIDTYNHGEMFHDFTYIDDLVHGIPLLIDVVPGQLLAANPLSRGGCAVRRVVSRVFRQMTAGTLPPLPALGRTGLASRRCFDAATA